MHHRALLLLRRFFVTADAKPVEQGLLGQHTFGCALPTRGAVCDCHPPLQGADPLLAVPETQDEHADIPLQALASSA